MPLSPFREVRDPDEKRRELVWIALSFIVILASWLAVVLLFGYRPLVMGMTYDEVVLTTGLALLVFCAIIYLAAREREQRATNKTLVRQLHGAVSTLDERVGQLNDLCETSSELAGALDYHQIAQGITNGLLGTLASEAAYFTLLEAGSGRVIFEYCEPVAAACAGIEGIDPQFITALTDAIPTASTRSVVIQLAAAGRMARARMPIETGIIGLIGAKRHRGHAPFSADDCRILATLANMALKAIESAQLHRELHESYLATVHSLVNSLHERDNYTAAHGLRVAALAGRIAERMGLGESAMSDIETFGPLHDVGKIGIRDSILLKSGPLSDSERARCRDHCLAGERILRPLRPSAAALGMIRNHHETWEGRGYPDGLKGEQIPPLARVLQVADAFDAMISDRPYQGPLSEQEVLAHFRQYAGQLYDPNVVEALCAIAADNEHALSADVENELIREVELLTV